MSATESQHNKTGTLNVYFGSEHFVVFGFVTQSRKDDFPKVVKNSYSKIHI